MAKITTLCYIRKAGKVLMLYRNKHKEDINAGKWIGVGGKIEPGESPDACLKREVREETGLTLTGFRFRGIITFVSDTAEDEYMVLYEGLDFNGELNRDCAEGELRWIPENDIFSLSLWEGDRLFLEPFFGGDALIFLKLVYQGDQLVYVEDSGKPALKSPDDRIRAFLWQDITAQIQEAQVKLGYARETMRFYYPVESLAAICGTAFGDAAGACRVLTDAFQDYRLTSADDTADPAGSAPPLSFRPHAGGVEVTAAAQVAEYVRDNIPASAFLKELIIFFAENHHASIGQIMDLFSRHSEAACIRMREESGFSYALYFLDEEIDPHVYCIGMEMGHTIYHRFSRPDYKRLVSRK